MKARVGQRGQVTIPKGIRESLGMKAGTVLELSEEDGRLIAVKAPDLDPVSEVYGYLGKGIDTESLIAQLPGRQRIALAPHLRHKRNGVPILPSQKRTRLVSPEIVNRLRDEG